MILYSFGEIFIWRGASYELLIAHSYVNKSGVQIYNIKIIILENELTFVRNVCVF